MEIPMKQHYSSRTLLVFFGLILISVVLGSRPPVSQPMTCEYYNETLCHNSGIGCNGTDECKPTEFEKGNQCYVLWRNTSEGPSIVLKGCWVGNHESCHSGCTENLRGNHRQLVFCCCEGHMCNQNWRTMPLHVIRSRNSTDGSLSAALVPSTEPPPGGWGVALYTLGPLAVVCLVGAAGYYGYRRRKLNHHGSFDQVPTRDPAGNLSPPSPPIPRPLQLLQVKAQGRFGAVWKARLASGELVAVKVFPYQDKASWTAEKEVYRLPQLRHANILEFVGVGMENPAELWLVTAYHEHGSLWDYLKAHVVTWEAALTIAITMVRGLRHLHEELPQKPAVAHRDFKSKNVLIKADMTACIADFGLAIVFHRAQPFGEALGQVGTRRYMAPEVLEGAINFNQDAFLRIDIYACGLVLWELASRCSAQDGPIDEYRLPFEDVVGVHPTLEDMQEVVTQKKLRPTFGEHWRKHQGLWSLCETIEECWDQDADARLTASCVHERLQAVSRLTSSHHIISDLSTNQLLLTKESSI